MTKNIKIFVIGNAGLAGFWLHKIIFGNFDMLTIDGMLTMAMLGLSSWIVGSHYKKI